MISALTLDRPTPPGHITFVYLQVKKHLYFSENILRVHMEIQNYLEKLFDKYSEKRSSFQLHGLSQLIKNIKNDLSPLRSVELPFSKRSIYFWISGKRPVPLQDILYLLNNWKKRVSNDLDYTTMLNRCFLSTSGISLPGHSRIVKIPKHITKELAYLLGYTMGDGCLSQKKYKIQYNDADIEKLVLVNRLYSEIFNVKGKIKKHPQKEMYRLEITSKFCLYFLNRICEMPIGRKKDLRIPELIKKCSHKLQLYFLVGFFDAEGGYGSYFYSVTQHSLIILKDLAKIVDKEGIRAKLYGPYGPYREGESLKWILGMNVANYQKYVRLRNSRIASVKIRRVT